MRSFLAALLLVSQQATSFIPAVSTKSSFVARFGLEEDLEDVWKGAAKAGRDAALTTTDMVKDLASNCKSQAMTRIRSRSGDLVITQDTIEQAANEFMGAHEQIEKKYDEQLKASVKKAESRFVKAVAEAEKEFAKTMQRIEKAFEKSLKIEKTLDCLDRAKSHYIRTTAAAEEIFQIAIEKAELKFEEAKIKAEEVRHKEMEYFEENGKYMRNRGNYFSTFFGDLIAFSGI